MTLGILYHMPFWQRADGSLWEAEGSFARYVDSLAPYFDEVVLSVPVTTTPVASGSRVRASNVRLAPLPYFPGPRQFYPMLPEMMRRLKAWVDECDIVHLRVPSPAAIFAFRYARRRRKPTVLLIVGDYAALLPHLPYRGIRRALFGAYVAFEEWALRYMAVRSLVFTNGAALRRKHEAQGARVHETKTTTLRQEDIGSRADTCQSGRIRLLTVSRIDPRKGLRLLPAIVARLVAAGHDVSLDLVGPPIGQIGEAEVAALREEARVHGVEDRLVLTGAVPLDELIRRYPDYDAFVLPTGPGEGIPRVLLEAMASGLPIVTTNVSGISSLIESGVNGLLVDGTAEAVANALDGLLTQPERRQALIAGGYRTAHAHTLERQAASLMRVLQAEIGIRLKPVAETA